MNLKSNQLHLILLCALLSFFGCKKKEVCGTMNDISQPGITIGDPFCTDTAFVIADRPFIARYTPSAGNDESYNFEWTIDDRFTPIEGNTELETKTFIPPIEGVADICLKINNTCGESTESACRKIGVINTPFIYYNIGRDGLPNDDPIPTPVTSYNFADSEMFKYDNKAYMLLGHNSTTRTLYRYDQENERWDGIRDYTVNSVDILTSVSVTVKGSTAILFGTYGVWHLDMNSLSLTNWASYPNNAFKGALFSVAYNDDVYVGLNTDFNASNPEIFWYLYDPVTRTFSTRTSLFYTTDPGMLCHQVGNNILIGGGNYSNKFGNDASYSLYDPVGDSWTLSSIAGIEVPLLDFVYQDTIYVVTERSKLYYFDETQMQFVEIDTEPDTWPACWNPKPKLSIKFTSEDWVSGVALGDDIIIAESRTGAQDFAVTPIGNYGYVLRMKALE